MSHDAFQTIQLVWFILKYTIYTLRNLDCVLLRYITYIIDSKNQNEEFYEELRNNICLSKQSNSIPPGDEAKADVPQEWLDMKSNCVTATKKQIQMEIDASMVYLSMGAHFSKDTVNRPGFSEFFFKAAAEEREHGHKLIEYLLMRGQLSGGQREITNLIKINVSLIF